MNHPPAADNVFVCSALVTKGKILKLIPNACGSRRTSTHAWAGSDGANVLVMQYARPSDRPGSDPKEMAKRDPNAYVEKEEEVPGLKMNWAGFD